jgi:hypothetical protein
MRSVVVVFPASMCAMIPMFPDQRLVAPAMMFGKTSMNRIYALVTQ